MLDFTKTSKRFMSVGLIDGTTVCVRMPTKKVFDYMVALRDRLTNLTMSDMEQIAEVYEFTSAILSNNLSNQKFSSDYVAEILDIEDISTFFISYMDFVRGVTTDPNSASPQSLGTSQASADTNV